MLTDEWDSKNNLSHLGKLKAQASRQIFWGFSTCFEAVSQEMEPGPSHMRSNNSSARI